MPAEHAPGWTDERTARLKHLWTDQGLSASEIAQELGGVSRNAVIGKISRLGLNRSAEVAATNHRRHIERVRSRPAQKPHPRQRPCVGFAPTPPEVLAERAKGVPVVAAPVTTTAKTLVELEPGECKRPVGEATGADQLFCARPTGGGAYCPACQADKPLTQQRTPSAADKDRSLMSWALKQAGRGAWR